MQTIKEGICKTLPSFTFVRFFENFSEKHVKKFDIDCKSFCAFCPFHLHELFGLERYSLHVFPLQKRKGSSYKHSGVVSVNKAQIRQIYTFLDYIKGGTEINAFIAIDFTGKLIKFWEKFFELACSLIFVLF